MNNVYFSNEGMTSTSANYYANIAKEMQNAATERLNSVKFFKTSVAVIGSNEKQLMSEGTLDLGFIESDLNTLASLNAFCAWVREAIKEKENQSNEVNKITIERWARLYGIELPNGPELARDPETITEQDVMNSWDINKRNKYLRLEAFAATFGKYIHVDGTYSKARKEAHKRLNNPISKEGTGRDMVLYYSEPSIPIDQVDGLFLSLQDRYRSYEKELNFMKAELKETANTLNIEARDKYFLAIEEYRALNQEFQAKWTELRNQFNNWRTQELERISKLKITVPDNLKNIFKTIQEAGDASK